MCQVSPPKSPPTFYPIAFFAWALNLAQRFFAALLIFDLAASERTRFVAPVTFLLAEYPSRVLKI